MKIGEWVRRQRAGAKWHAVESVIAGDAVTHCGRRMRPKTATHVVTPLQISPVMPLTRMIGQPQLCQDCQRLSP